MRCLERALSKFTPVQKVLAKAFASFLGIWNLDFFRSVYSPFCLNPHTDTLHVMALDYLIAIYPLLLIGLSYLLVLFYDHNFRLVVFLCKPFVSLNIRFRRQWLLLFPGLSQPHRPHLPVTTHLHGHLPGTLVPMALGTFVISQHFTFYSEVQCMPSQCWPISSLAMPTQLYYFYYFPSSLHWPSLTGNTLILFKTTHFWFSLSLFM